MLGNSSSERRSFSDNIHVLVSDSNATVVLFRPYRRLREEVLAQNVSYVQLLGNLELANMAFCLIYGFFGGKFERQKRLIIIGCMHDATQIRIPQFTSRHRVVCVYIPTFGLKLTMGLMCTYSVWLKLQ